MDYQVERNRSREGKIQSGQILYRANTKKELSMSKDTKKTPTDTPTQGINRGTNQPEPSTDTNILKFNNLLYANAPYQTQMKILEVLLESLCEATTVTQDIASVVRSSARTARDIADRSGLTYQSVRKSVGLMVNRGVAAIAPNHPMGKAFYMRIDGLPMLLIGMERGWVNTDWREHVKAASDWISAIEAYHLRKERENWQSKQKANRPKARTPLNQQQVVIKTEPEDYPVPEFFE